MRPSRVFEAGEKGVEEGEPGGGLAVRRREVLREAGCVAGERRLAPAAAQVLAQGARRGLAEGVEVCRGAGGVEEVAGVEEVVLSEEGGLRADGALDERRHAAVVGREPCDDVARPRPRPDRQHDPFGLDDFTGHGQDYSKKFRMIRSCELPSKNHKIMFWRQGGDCGLMVRFPWGKKKEQGEWKM